MARGDSTTDSDVDILVDVDPSIGLGFVTLAERLEKDLGRKVEQQGVARPSPHVEQVAVDVRGLELGGRILLVWRVSFA